MKFRITFKDPDGVGNSMKTAVEDAIETDIHAPTDPDERHAIMEIRQEKMEEFIRTWIEFGEYLRVEFDTEAGTATVLKVRS